MRTWENLFAPDTMVTLFAARQSIIPHPLNSSLHCEGVSQLCFDFVAAIFRLRKLLEFNNPFSQTKVCGYRKPNCDTVSVWRGGQSLIYQPALRAWLTYLAT